MSELISIVVPVYQVEQYIENCMESICFQTYSNIEVVLVNDGTKDKSIFLAERILKKSNISYMVIDQDNKGLAAARNTGIKNSRGEWVICIDPDDIIHREFLKILYESSVKYNVDIAIGGFQNVNIKELFKEADTMRESLLIYKRKMMQGFLTRQIKIIAPAILVEKKHIIANNLYYNEKIGFSEDQEYIWRLLLSSEKYVYNRTPIYNYLRRQNSIMTSSTIEKILTGYYGFVEFTSKLRNSEYSDITKFILPRWILGALRTASKIMSYEDFVELTKKMNYRKHIKKMILFPEPKAKILSILMLINKKYFYLTCKKA